MWPPNESDEHGRVFRWCQQHHTEVSLCCMQPVYRRPRAIALWTRRSPLLIQPTSLGVPYLLLCWTVVPAIVAFLRHSCLSSRRTPPLTPNTTSRVPTTVSRLPGCLDGYFLGCTNTGSPAAGSIATTTALPTSMAAMHIPMPGRNGRTRLRPMRGIVRRVTVSSDASWEDSHR